jgi:hypothetical protein
MGRRSTTTSRAGRKSARPGAGERLLRWSGRHTLRAGKWTGKAVGGYAARKGRRTLENLVSVIDDKRVHRAHTGGTSGAKITCACSDCKGKTWHSASDFKDHMLGAGSQYLQGVPSARIGAVTPKPKPKPTTKPTASAADRAAAFWNRSNMSEIAGFVKAAELVAQMDPSNADEFDQMLGGLATAYLKIADSVAAWAEKLDAEVGIDPKVTAPMYHSADSIGEAGKHFRTSRQKFQSVYAPQLEAMGKGVRQPKRPDFFAA